MANWYESEMERSDRRAERMAVSVSMVIVFVRYSTFSRRCCGSHCMSCVFFVSLDF